MIYVACAIMAFTFLMYVWRLGLLQRETASCCRVWQRNLFKLVIFFWKLNGVISDLDTGLATSFW